MIPEQQTEQFLYMVQENYKKRNVWFLEMGARESKTKSLPKTPTRTDCGSGTRTMTSSHSALMKPVRSANPQPVPVWLENSLRWQSKYDVYICHSEEEADCSYAMEMLSYLEQQPEKLRCFLPMRDMLAGGAITSEMCSGLESSHCWVMLLTPHFLSDSWCKYQMHQFLAQAPCSNGRLIPVMLGLSFAQYPPEVKHMYAFKGAFNDNSVFIKIKGAILAYLKEMITVTRDKIPVHSPSSRTSDRSQSTSETVGNSQEESSVTQESTSDRSSRISMTQEVPSVVSMGSTVTHETTSDMSSKLQMTQGTTSNMSMRSLVTQETTGDMSIRSAVTQEVTTSDVSSRTQMTQENTSDMSMRNSLTPEITSDMSMRSSVTQETTCDMFPRTLMTQETTSNMSMGSSLIQEFTTDVSSRTPMTQETTSDVSSSSSVTRKTTSGTSLSSSLAQKTTSDMSSRITVTQETTSEVKLRSLVLEETSSDVSMRSSVTRQETTNEASMNSSVMGLETSCLSLSPLIMNNRDVCTDYKWTMTATKDSFSGETRIDTGDSGVWSITKDLHTNSDLYTSGVQTVKKHLPSDCSDLYTSRMDELTGKDSHPQTVISDSHALHSDLNI